MNDVDPAQLVERLKRGGAATHQELASIREKLQRPSPEDDVYDLVRALALGTVTAQPSDVRLVEPYLLDNDDDWTLQGAIYALCSYWNLTEKYVFRLAELITREAWEEYSDAAIAGIGALAEHAFATGDPGAFRLLLEGYDEERRAFDAGGSDFDALRFGLFYRALDVAYRGRQALRDHIRTKSPDEVDEVVIDHARKQSRPT